MELQQCSVFAMHPPELRKTCLHHAEEQRQTEGVALLDALDRAFACLMVTESRSFGGYCDELTCW